MTDCPADCAATKYMCCRCRMTFRIGKPRTTAGTYSGCPDCGLWFYHCVASRGIPGRLYVSREDISEHRAENFVEFVDRMGRTKILMKHYTTDRHDILWPQRGKTG